VVGSNVGKEDGVRERKIEGSIEGKTVIKVD
jgi:hypothetical protein